MKTLTYYEIRNLVKSNQISLDINPNLFNHPNYNSLPITELDSRIKEFSFKNLFMTLMSSSMHSAAQDALVAERNIGVKACLNPQKPFLNTRAFTKTKNNFNLFLNFVYHTPYIKIKARTMQIIPLSILVKEAIRIPNLVMILNEELTKQGLMVVNITPSYEGQELTYVTLYNSSGKTIKIKDLTTLGNIRILSERF